MVIKPPSPSIELLQVQALLRRCPYTHPSMPLIQDDLKKWTSGYQGEKAVDFYLKMFPEEDFHIFYGLRLPREGGQFYFQIDVLLICSRFFLILENKNHGGLQIFEPEYKEHLRELNGKIDTFQDPITQAESQLKHLRNWLINHRLPTAPMDYFVTFSNPTARFQTPPNYKKALDKICHLHQLPSKIENSQAKFKTDVFTPKELKKVSRLLLKEHTVRIPQIDRLRVSPSDIVDGVICPKCGEAPMERIYGRWHCPICQADSKDAHVQAILDSLLLIKPTMTNRECRDFLGIESREVAYKLLDSMGLPMTGSGRNRIYHHPFNKV